MRAMNDANVEGIIVLHFWIECIHFVGDDEGIFNESTIQFCM